MYRLIGGVLLGVVVLAALVGGCGEGSEASSGLSQEDFTQEAEAICSDGKVERQTALAGFYKEVKDNEAKSKSFDQAELAQKLLYQSFLPSMNQQLQELEDLGAPEGDEEQIAKMLGTLSTEIKSVEDGGLGTFIDDGFAGFESEARAYGFTCSA